MAINDKTVRSVMGRFVETVCDAVEENYRALVNLEKAISGKTFHVDEARKTAQEIKKTAQEVKDCCPRGIGERKS